VYEFMQVKNNHILIDPSLSRKRIAPFHWWLVEKNNWALSKEKLSVRLLLA
jgi:hypothetical protein